MIKRFAMLFLIIALVSIKACIIEQNDGKCAFCKYTLFSPLQIKESTLTPSKTECQANSKIMSSYNSEVFIGTSACGSRTCTGTSIDPYDNLGKALQKEFIKAQSYFYAVLTFNLQIGTHSLVSADLSQFPKMKQFFRRKLWTIIIKPADQNIPTDVLGSMQDQGQRPIILLKTDQLYFFISSQLTIYNIVFDGADIHLGFQAQFAAQSNLPQKVCSSGTALAVCTMSGSSYAQTVQGQRTNSLFNLETILELSDAQSLDVSVSAFVNSNQDKFPNFPPIPTLNLLNVDFISMYLGLSSGTSVMTGFRGLINMNLGKAIILLNTIDITRTFFPDGVFGVQFTDNQYLGNGDYLSIYSDSSLVRKIQILNLEIKQYNQWQVGTKLSPTAGNLLAPEPSYYNTLFSFGSAKHSVDITSISITESIITSTFNGNPLFGNVILLFSLTTEGSTQITNLNFIGNKNFALVYVGAGVELRINGESNLGTSFIERPIKKFNKSPQFFSIVNEISLKLTLENVVFSELQSHLILITGTSTFLTKCQFVDIDIAEGQFLFLSEIQSSQGIDIDQSEISRITGFNAKSSTFFFVNYNQNYLRITNSKIHDCTKLSILDNSDINYSIYFKYIQFYSMQDVILCAKNRFRYGEFINVNFRYIESEYQLIGLDGNDGGTPFFSVYHTNFENMILPSIIMLQTIRQVHYMTNITLSNITCSGTVFSLCCGFLKSNLTTFREVYAPLIFYVPDGNAIIAQLDFLASTKSLNLADGYSTTFLRGQNGQVITFGNSTLVLGSGIFFDLSQCLQISVNSTQLFVYKATTVFQATAVSILTLLNITIKGELPNSQINKQIVDPISHEYLFSFSGISISTLQQIEIEGIDGVGLIKIKDSGQSMIDQFIITNLNCGLQTCFFFINGNGVTTIKNSDFNAIQSGQGKLIEITFSSSLILIYCTFDTIQVRQDFSVIKAFQTIMTIQNIRLSMITQQITNSQSPFESMMLFQDSPSLSISNVTIDNSRSQLDQTVVLVGGIATLLVNSITIDQLIINTAFSKTLPLIGLQEFSDLSITKIQTQRCQSTTSILYIQTSLKNLEIAINGFSCISNRGKTSSCIELETASNFEIREIVGEDLNGCVISANSDNNAIVKIQGCRFSKITNSLKDSSQNRVFNFEGCTVYISNMQLVQVYDQNNVFSLHSSSLSIFGSLISSLYSQELLESIGNTQISLYIFVLDSSNLIIERCSIVNNEPNQKILLTALIFSAVLPDEDEDINQNIVIPETLGTHLIKSSQSTINFVSSLIYGLSDRIFTLEDGDITIKDSQFIENINCLYLDTSEVDVSIENSYFVFSKSKQVFNLLNDQESIRKLMIQNLIIEFTDEGKAGIIDHFNTIQITNLTIQRKQTQLEQSGEFKGIGIFNFQTLNIQDSHFKQMTSVEGGCLVLLSGSVNSLSTLEIQNSTFSNCNSSGIAGALYMQGGLIGSITKCQFQQNSATIGGALVYNAPKIIKDKLIINSCTFVANSAKEYGGSTMILDKDLETKGLIYEANMAVSQTNSGQCATKLGNLGSQNITQLETIIDDFIAIKELTQRALIEIDQSNVITIASGQTFQWVIALLDDTNHLVNVDSSTTLIISAPTGSGTQTLVDNGVSTSKNGLLLFKQLKITHKPGEKFKLQLKVNFAFGRLDYSNEVQFREKIVTYDFFSRLCLKGEIYNSDNTCQVCTVSTYSLPDPQDERLQAQSCQYCPATASCIQEAIYPGYGYWIMNQDSMLVLKCITDFYCIGKTDLYEQRLQSSGVALDRYVELTTKMYDEQCITGQAGVLCQECEFGYFKFTSSSQCLPCEGNKAITFLVIILVIGLLMAYSIYQSQNYMAKNQEGQDKAVLIKIFLNYFQTISLLGAANLNWSPNITSVFDFSSDFFGAKFNFVSVQCLATDYATNVNQQFYMNMLVQMAIPFLIFLFNSIYFIVTVFIAWTAISKKRLEPGMTQSQQKQKESRHELTSMSLYIVVLNGVVCLHLFYPLLTSTPTQLFSCFTVSEDIFGNQVQYLSKNMHIECWTQEFNSWFYAFGICASVFFGLGIPGLLCFYMWVYKNDLKDLDKSIHAPLSSNTKRSALKQSEAASKIRNRNANQSIMNQTSQIQQFDFKPAAVNAAGSQEIPDEQRVQPSVFNSLKLQTKEKKSFSRLETIKKIKRVAMTKGLTNNLRKSIKRKQLKQSEVFMFLVDPYKSKVFYWEIVILLRKFILIMIGLLSNIASQDPQNKSVKYLLLNIYMVIFFRFSLQYDPFFSPLFNLAENVSFMVVIITCMAGILTSVFSGTSAQVVSDLIFFGTNIIYLVFMGFIFYSLVQKNDQKSQEKGSRTVRKIVAFFLNKHKIRHSANINSSRIEEDPGLSVRG